jgi:hypothetical protein
MRAAGDREAASQHRQRPEPRDRGRDRQESMPRGGPAELSGVSVATRMPRATDTGGLR